MGQTWESLVFVHWRVAVDELRRHIPAGLEIEEFDGSAWLGIVPFLAARANRRLCLTYVRFRR